MRFDNMVSNAASTVGTELKLKLQYGIRLFAPALGLWAGLVLISTPVLAQNIPKKLVCSGAGKLISAVFALLVFLLIGVGIYHLIDGWRKINSPNPEKKKKGREAIKGGGLMFVGALFSTGLPTVLQTVGLKVFSCIDITPL